jgi:hypothetical protein
MVLLKSTKLDKENLLYLQILCGLFHFIPTVLFREEFYLYFSLSLFDWLIFLFYVLVYGLGLNFNIKQQRDFLQHLFHSIFRRQFCFFLHRISIDYHHFHFMDFSEREIEFLDSIHWLHPCNAECHFKFEKIICIKFFISSKI